MLGIVLQAVLERYKELDDKLFDAYIEEKSNPIVGAIEQNMYRGRFDWKTCKKPAGKVICDHVKHLFQYILFTVVSFLFIENFFHGFHDKC